MQTATVRCPKILLRLAVVLFVTLLPATARSQYPRLMQGPMVGAVSPDPMITSRLMAAGS